MSAILIGNRAIQRRLGLNRAQTSLLIEAGVIRRWFNSEGQSCADAAEVDAAGRNLPALLAQVSRRWTLAAAVSAWEGEGGAPHGLGSA